jgi:hypothetical protein
MLSQLIVHDFTGGARTFTFGEFTKAHDSAVAYSSFLELFGEAVYLINYDRYHSNKALLQVVFLFRDEDHAKLTDRNCDDPEGIALRVRMDEVLSRYRSLMKGLLVAVKYENANIICEVVPAEPDQSVTNDYTWLICPIADLPEPPSFQP